jgi:hypothetical protein
MMETEGEKVTSEPLGKSWAEDLKPELLRRPPGFSATAREEESVK